MTRPTSQSALHDHRARWQFRLDHDKHETPLVDWKHEQRLFLRGFLPDFMYLVRGVKICPSRLVLTAAQFIQNLAEMFQWLTYMNASIVNPCC